MDSNDTSSTSKATDNSSNDIDLSRLEVSLAEFHLNMEQISPEPVPAGNLPTPSSSEAVSTTLQSLATQNEILLEGFTTLQAQVEQLTVVVSANFVNNPPGTGNLDNLGVLVPDAVGPNQGEGVAPPVVNPVVQGAQGSTLVTNPSSRIAFATKLNLPSLDKYDGKRTDDACYDWIRSVRSIIEADDAFREDHMNQGQLLAFVASHLQKDALAWSEGVKNRDLQRAPGVKIPTSVNELLEEIEKYFTPLDLQARLRLSWKDLKQGKSTVNQFQSAFLRLINRIQPPIPAQEQSQKFLDALNPWLHQEVLKTIRMPKGSHFITILDHTLPSPDFLFQMAAISESIWLENRDCKREFKEDRNSRRQSSARLNTARAGKKVIDLSTTECYNCRKTGHHASNCPDKAPGEGQRVSSRGRGREGGRGRGRGRGNRGRGGSLHAVAVASTSAHGDSTPLGEEREPKT